MKKMNLSFFWLCLALVVALNNGCVAQKPSTAHNTLKGDNSVEQAMPNSLDLPKSGFITLSELTDRFADDLAEETSGRKVYLDRANIRDTITGDVANFSSYLINELEASLSSRGFLLQVIPDDADIFLGATFQLYSNQMKIFLKYHSPDFTVNRSLDYGIERSRLPKDSRKENLHSKAYQLAANIIEDDQERMVYIKPLESSECKCVSPFSRTFATMVKGEIVRMHPQVAVVDEKPLKMKLSDTRAISKKAKDVKNLENAEAYYSDADSVLEGEYVVNGDQVMVTLLLKDLKGHVLNSCFVDIDSTLIKIPLQNKTSSKLADLADRKAEDSGAVVKLFTSHSGDYPVYNAGENIVFYAQVKRPLYLHIYDIDSRGGVSLLYPYEPGAPQQQTFPGQLKVIPDEMDGFEFIVEPPFGTDGVKVFASPVAMPVPDLNPRVATRSYSSGVRAIGKRRKQVQSHLASRKSINPNDLVDYYRGLARKMNIPLYEDSIVVETKR